MENSPAPLPARYRGRCPSGHMTKAVTRENVGGQNGIWVRCSCGAIAWCDTAVEVSADG